MKFCKECKEYYNGKTITGVCGKCYQRFKNRTVIYEIPKKGEIKYTEDGKIVCHICGQCYNKLLAHVNQVHKMDAQTYKKKFGLDLYKGIMSNKSRQLARKKLLENYNKVVVENLINNEKSIVNRFKKGHQGRTINKVSIQTLKRLKQPSFVKKQINNINKVYNRSIENNK